MSSFFDEGDPDERARIEDAAARRSRRRSRIALLVLGVVVLLVAAGYAALCVHSAGRVPWGTRVQGVPIGGLTADQAAARLRVRLEPDLHRALTFVHEQDRYRVVPARAGLSIDYEATVRAAGGDTDSATPARLWQFLAGGGMVAPVVHVDQRSFDRTLHSLADRIGRPLVEGDVRFGHRRARPVYGQPGITVEPAEMREAVRNLLFDPTTVLLPVSRHRPYVGVASVHEAMREFGRPAMSAPVTVVIAGHRVVVPPRVFGPLLSMVPSGHRLVPVLDGDRLAEAMRPLMHGLGDKPRSAQVRIVDGRPRVRPAVTGVSFDNHQLARAFLAHLRRTGPARTLHLHAAVQPPARTTADVRSLGIRERVGSATVPVGSRDADRAGRLDGTLLRPGQELAVSRVLGSPSTALATAMSEAARRAGLAVETISPAEGHRGGSPARPEVRDATVRNDGDHAALVDVQVYDGRATVSLWSTPDRKAGRHTGRDRPTGR